MKTAWVVVLPTNEDPIPQDSWLYSSQMRWIGFALPTVFMWIKSGLYY